METEQLTQELLSHLRDAARIEGVNGVAVALVSDNILSGNIGYQVVGGYLSQQQLTQAIEKIVRLIQGFTLRAIDGSLKYQMKNGSLIYLAFVGGTSKENTDIVIAAKESFTN